MGNKVSSAGVRVITVGGGKEAVRAVRGYIPQKVCCIDSKARGMGVARRYIISASAITLGMKPS